MGSHLRLTRKAKSKDMLISWEDLSYDKEPVSTISTSESRTAIGTLSEMGIHMFYICKK